MMYYMGFTYAECYNLPVWMRKWFLERIQKEIKRSQESGGEPTPTHAYHQNTPDSRAMMGRMRSQVPANLRRFT